MKRTFAASALCLSLVACTPAPVTQAPAATTATRKVDCNDQRCLSSKLQSLDCTPSRQRRFAVTVQNTSSGAVRYRLDYDVPEINLEQGDGQAQIMINASQTHTHNFVSSTFNKNLKVTVTQLTADGAFIADEIPLEVNLKLC